VSERWQVPALVALQAVFALTLARLLAWRDLDVPLVVVTLGAVLLLLTAARLVLGPAPW
jgi:hypothetical protein